MSYRSERFNRRMRSVEVMVAGFADPSKAKIFSDGGVGARAVREGLGQGSRSRAEEETREEKLFEAEMRLVEAGKGYLIRVLLLIVENGANREESLRSVAKRTYFRHRDALLRFFSQPQPSTSTPPRGTQVHMEI